MFFTTPVVSYIIYMYTWNQQPHLLQTVDDGSSFANFDSLSRYLRASVPS